MYRFTKSIYYGKCDAVNLFQADRFHVPSWALAHKRDDAATFTDTCLSIARHGDATGRMRGVATGYPAFDKRSGKTIDLQDRSNACGAEHQQPVFFAAESRPLFGLATATGANELVELELYLSDRTAGMPVETPVI